MSGMEVLGLLASVTQLARYGISIHHAIREIYGHAQYGPRGLQQHLDQLDRLIDTARSIEENSVFHPNSVQKHLDALIVQAEGLQTVLEKLKTRKPQSTLRKYWNAYLRTGAEKQIFTIFAKIEQEKSALQLSMTMAHTSLSSRTQTDLAQNTFTVEDTRCDVKEVLSRSMAIEAQLETLKKGLPAGGITTVDGAFDAFQSPVDATYRDICPAEAEHWPRSKRHVQIQPDDMLEDAEPEESSDDSSPSDFGHSRTSTMATTATLVSTTSSTTPSTPPLPNRSKTYPPPLRPRRDASHQFLLPRPAPRIPALPTARPTQPPTYALHQTQALPHTHALPLTQALPPRRPAPRTNSAPLPLPPPRPQPGPATGADHGHSYKNMWARSKALQLNANVGGARAGARRHRYEDVCAEEGSFQINGDVGDAGVLRGFLGGVEWGGG